MQRTFRSGCLTILFPLLCLSAQAQEPKSTGDAAALAGIWKATGLEGDGQARPERDYSGTTIAFEGDRVTFTERGQAPIIFRFELGADQTPKTIDLIIPSGRDQGQGFKGIYELDGDDLKLGLCVSGPRPEKFQTKRGDKTDLFTLERLPAEQPWERLTVKDDGYSVEMPGKPEARKRRDDSAGIPVEATIYVVRSDRERISFLAMGYKLPVAFADDAAMKQGLDAAIQKLLKEFQGRIIREQELTPKNGIAREFFVHSQLGADALVHIYVMKNRLVMVQAVGLDDLPNSKSAARFLKSFELTE